MIEKGYYYCIIFFNLAGLLCIDCIQYISLYSPTNGGIITIFKNTFFKIQPDYFPSSVSTSFSRGMAGMAPGFVQASAPDALHLVRISFYSFEESVSIDFPCIRTFEI